MKQNMFGIVGFEHLKINCIIGINPEERVREQEIYVDLKVELDFAACAATGKIQDTLDYVYLADLCTTMAQAEKYQLMESFAYAIIHKLSQDPRVAGSWIKVKKPQALSSAAFAMVELRYGI